MIQLFAAYLLVFCVFQLTISCKPRKRSKEEPVAEDKNKEDALGKIGDEQLLITDMVIAVTEVAKDFSLPVVTIKRPHKETYFRYSICEGENCFSDLSKEEDFLIFGSKGLTAGRLLNFKVEACVEPSLAKDQESPCGPIKEYVNREGQKVSVLST